MEGSMSPSEVGAGRPSVRGRRRGAASSSRSVHSVPKWRSNPPSGPNAPSRRRQTAPPHASGEHNHPPADRRTPRRRTTHPRRRCHSRTVAAGPVVAPAWRCPVCRSLLSLSGDRRVWSCDAGHDFDVAREGYVNLLLAGQHRSRRPGDSPEMVRARRRFLATGHYDALSEAVAAAAADAIGTTQSAVLLDVGCGEGHHTRALQADVVLGIDVSKVAVASAARAHPAGRYAVASGADVPLADASVDAAVVVFGPAVPGELARVVRPGGAVVAAHPGPSHLQELRALVYPEPHPHEVKPPLRGSARFEQLDAAAVCFPVEVADRDILSDLFTMTPYRWHAPPDMDRRLDEATARPFTTVADVRVTSYRRLRAP